MITALEFIQGGLKQLHGNLDKQLADQIQKVALDEVAYVPWGEWFQPTAFRKNVQGILKFPAPVFWNVSIT